MLNLYTLEKQEFTFEIDGRIIHRFQHESFSADPYLSLGEKCASHNAILEKKNPIHGLKCFEIGLHVKMNESTVLFFLAEVCDGICS